MARMNSGDSSRRLEQLWRESPPAGLRGLAWLYALGWRAYAGVYRLGLKRRAQMPIPVIGIGSLWVGGVSKTPLTVAVARYLQALGVRIAALTHGYGGSCYRTGALLDPREYPDASIVGDEAVELRLALPDTPLAVGKWRVPMAQAAIERWSPDALVLDDGFQHLPLARALDLVLLPAESPLGNGYCLPAGPLREPPDGLRRADGVVLVRTSMPLATGEAVENPHPRPLSHSAGEGSQTGCLSTEEADVRPHPRPLSHSAGEGSQMHAWGVPEVAAYTATIAPTALLHLSSGERLPLERLQGRPLTLLCGIARPERFRRMADALGYTVERMHIYRDHHAYTPEDLQPLAGKTVLTTMKDAVKLRERLPSACDAYALQIEAHLDEALRARLQSLFTGTPHCRRES
ncbi:MAG: tetraacyldisaccharide 4'-kinase [Fimbriimonadales bacterium]